MATEDFASQRKNGPEIAAKKAVLKFHENFYWSL